MLTSPIISLQAVPMTSSTYKPSEKVCAVICNWNKVQELFECIESVLKSDFSNFDLVVVDNGSDPEIRLEIKKRLPASVILLENQTNKGAGGGFNSGMQYALDCGIYDSVWLLDNEVIIDPSCLTELIKELRQSKNNAIVGAITLSMDFPDQVVELGVHFDQKEISFHHFFRDCSLSTVNTPAISVDYVATCCLIVDTQKLKLTGLIDESYFLYYDDIEWCLKFKNAGYDVRATPYAKVWHPWHRPKNKKNNSPLYYTWRNKTHFFLHHMDPSTEMNAFIDKYLMMSVLPILFTTLKLGKTNAFNTILYAVIDGFSGVRGKIKEEKILPVDSCTYGSDFTDGIQEMILICDPLINMELIRPFLKAQKHLFLPVLNYGGHGNAETIRELIESQTLGPSAGKGNSKTFLVLCGHVLTKPNVHEESLHAFLLQQDTSVYFIDPFTNVVHGYNKMRQLRNEYHTLLATVSIFRDEFIRLFFSSRKKNIE